MKRILILPVLFISFTSFSQISMEKSDDGILIKEGSSKILFYQTEVKSKDGLYGRNNYIHPVWGIDGNVLTEDFPDDHLHHRGIFWTWHQIYIDEKRIGDPWMIEDFIQEVSKADFILSAEEQGILKTEVYWKSPLWMKDGEMKPYIKENTKITIHKQEKNVRRLDFEIKLLALEEGLVIGGSEDAKAYGGFSVRLKLPDDVSFEGENGIVTPQTLAVKEGNYINISGSMSKNDEKGGVVMLSHSNNPGQPQLWILRNKSSMQNAVYPGKELASLSVNKALVLRYSLLIYKGSLSQKQIQKYF